MRILFTSAFVACLTGFGCSCSSTISSVKISTEGLSDKERLQGNWLVVKFEADDNPPDKEEVGNMKFRFEADLLTFPAKSGKNVRFELRPDKDPKEIDLLLPDAMKSELPAVGIYRFDGERLVICLGTSAGVITEAVDSSGNVLGKKVEPAKRPTKFTTEGAYLITMTREKK